MACRVCLSAKEAEFSTEMMIHFSGRKHLLKPGVLIFPEMVVCLDCGATRLTIPEGTLESLRDENTSLTTAESYPGSLDKRAS